MKLMGALLLIGGCFAAGLARSRELRRRVAEAETVLSALEGLETEVCRLHTPLPEALGRLAPGDGGVFAPLGDLEGGGEGAPPSQRRQEALAALALGQEPRSVLTELTEALARGGEPDRAFAVARERLDRLLRAARREATEKCRLSSALGLCAGLLLAILLA